LLDFAHKLCRVQTQRAFGIEAFGACRGGEFEEHAAEHRVIELGTEGIHLCDIDRAINGKLFLFDLLPNRLRKHERGQARRLVLENRTGRDVLAAGLLFLRLDLLPLGEHLVSRIQFSITKNMRVAPDELFINFTRDILEVELPRLLGELRVKDDLDQYVAQFLAHVRQVEAVDRVDQFAAFVDQATHQRSMGLFLIPGAAAGGTQPGNRLAQVIHRTHSPKLPESTREYTEFFGFVFGPEPYSLVRMSDKLTEIMTWKRQEIASRLRPVTEEELAKLDASLPRPPSFSAALQRSDGNLAVIAEIKRRSPSAGAIREGISATEQALRYQAAGASALSVLTDEKYFSGSLEDLRAVTAQFRERAPALPCLRKDFMVHPVQIAEAREGGASAILIIVRALNDDEIKLLFTHAKAAGLDSLFEIHNEAELERALSHGAKIIGVNNRDLSIFKTDLSLSERLIPKFPRAVIAVSESGIFNGTDAARVHAAGAHAVLVGEALMKAPDAAQLIADFRN